MLEKTAKLIDGVVSLLTGFIAAVLLLYSGYVVYDNFNTNRNAFSSWDLLKYKPVEDLAQDEGFQELLAINPDVKGWITFYNTNIDYPVLQGKDNMEYVNKDVYGNFSLSGAIYLASECAGDFSDPYSLIYGHHMENGAMFGGIDEFADPAYFASHTTGLIQTVNGNYDLRAFACVRTDAYESMIYSTQGKSYESLADYIKANAVSYDQKGAKAGGNLVALSTCADLETYGRLVLFCKAVPRTAPLLEENEQEPEKLRRRAMGHGISGSAWALLNLVCAVFTIYTLFPIGHLRTKFRQIRYSSRTARRLSESKTGPPADTGEKRKDSGSGRAENEAEEQAGPRVDHGGDSTDSAPVRAENEVEEQTGPCVDHGGDSTDSAPVQAENDSRAQDSRRKERLIRDLRRYVKIMTAGLVLEVGAAVGAGYLFYITEDIRRQMVIQDRWTPYMIGLFALALLVDFICFRYRGMRPEELEENRAEKKAENDKQ